MATKERELNQRYEITPALWIVDNSLRITVLNI